MGEEYNIYIYIYIEEVARETKRHFDPSNQPLKLCQCPLNIYDSQPPYQSKHKSLELDEAVTPCVRPEYQATDPWSEGAADRDKSQSIQIQLTEAIISDRVAKRDGLIILPTKELVDGLIT